MTMFSMKPKFDLAQFIQDSEDGKGAPKRQRHVRKAPVRKREEDDAVASADNSAGTVTTED